MLFRSALFVRPPVVLPGVRSLLRALTTLAIALGVCTGNFRRNALLKLESAGLADWFLPLRGGFGDLHADRADVVREALALCDALDKAGVTLVGDTVFDMIAARSAGLRAVGVATGHATQAELTSSRAHAVLRDFSRVDEALAAVLGDAA